MDRDEINWRGMQVMRSEPPPLAASGSRRRTMSAALRQSEALWRAAGSIDPAAQPIVMYYSVAQSGQALLAARVPGSNWAAMPSHGLVLARPSLRDDRVPTPGDIVIQDKGIGLFQQAATLLNSPTLPGSCTLTELICSLPNQEDLLFFDDEGPQPLSVHASDIPARADEKSDLIQLLVGPLPSDFDESNTDEKGIIVPPLASEVTQWLALYPTLASLGEPTRIIHVRPLNPTEEHWKFGVEVEWKIGEPLDWGERIRYCSQLFDVPWEGGAIAKSGFVLPAVAGNTQPLHPLMIWWAILYACSMLARYWPKEWVKLLDVDSSTHAVPMVTVLETAWSEAPRLLARELLAAYA